MDLTNNYQTITGTPDTLAKLAKNLKKAKQPFTWVKLTKTNPHERNEQTTALNISRDVWRVLSGQSEVRT